jgi:enoyl-CoA hydratase/carnithine racemase
MTDALASDLITEPILVAEASQISRITLNRPAALNAITVDLARALAQAVEEHGRSARVIVISGAGGNFCAGGDFHEFARLRDEGSEAVAALFDEFARACAAIAEAPVPVIAAVEGSAMAGGFELMQACDLAIVAEDARLADNHVNFGQVPGGGGSQRLPRLVGRQRALAHMLTGDRLSGIEAERWGLAYRAVPATRLDATVDELAARLAAKEPPAVREIKRLVRHGLERSLAEGLLAERDAVLAHVARAEAASGISAFAAGKRPG